MKAGTLMYTTIVMGVLLLQDSAYGNPADDDLATAGGYTVKKVNWDKKVSLKNERAQIKSLMDIIQYVVGAVFNGSEFHRFMIKRFYHSFKPQAYVFFGRIKELKMKMGGEEATAEDQKIDDAMENI